MTTPKKLGRKRAVNRISRDARKKIIELRNEGRGDYAIANRMANSQFKLAPAFYSREDRARVYTTLLSNEGNVKRTARDTGVNATTVRRWKREFATNPPRSHDTPPAGVTANDWLAIVREVLEEAGLPAVPRVTKHVRFWSRVVPNPVTKCWEWTGPFGRDGYGKFSTQRAHRFAWESLHGSLEGRQLHHVCRNKKCVNTAHLVPVADNSAHARLERMEREFIEMAEAQSLVANLRDLASA